MTTEVSVLLNNLINLECETKGIPVPTITWYKEGRPIISSPQALYVDRGQFLQIPRAQVSDSAKYTCRVTSAAGAAEKIYDVDVHGKQEFIEFGYLQCYRKCILKAFLPSEGICRAVERGRQSEVVFKDWPVLAGPCKGSFTPCALCGSRKALEFTGLRGML